MGTPPRNRRNLSRRVAAVHHRAASCHPGRQLRERKRGRARIEGHACQPRGWSRFRSGPAKWNQLAKSEQQRRWRIRSQNLNRTLPACSSSWKAIWRGPRMKLKILIADDDLLSRRMLRSKLERAGYDVVAVEDGTRPQLRRSVNRMAQGSRCSIG